MRRMITVAAALALCAGSTAFAQDYAKDKEAKKLTIGDQAPPIDIAHWIKGDKIDEFESGKVYVVEFWATWCGPCIASMPHLSELQEKYTDYDVKFISVSDEDLQTVVGFLFKEYKGDGKIHNDRTQYTLTTDPDKSVMNDYFRAAGQTGIPSAFIVGKDTKVEWIGHPMSMDEPLESIVKDTWDRDQFKVTFEENMAKQRLSQSMLKSVRDATSAKDWEAAIEAIDKLTALGDDYAAYKTQKYMILADQLKDYDRANAFAGEVVEQSWDNANALNQIAWFMVDEAGLENCDAALAMKAAKRANELTEQKNAALLDTLARIYYETGDVKSALKWQRMAADQLNGNESYAEDVRKYLKKYQQEVDSEI